MRHCVVDVTKLRRLHVQLNEAAREIAEVATLVLDEASNSRDISHYQLRADIDELHALLATPPSEVDAASLFRWSVGIQSRASDVLTDAAVIAESLHGSWPPARNEASRLAPTHDELASR